MQVRRGAPSALGQGCASAGQVCLLTYPSEGRARLGLCVGTLRLLGPLPDWGWPVQKLLPSNLGEQRTKVVWKGHLASEGRLPTAAHPLGVRKSSAGFPNFDPAGDREKPRCPSAQPEATQAG